MKKTIVYFIVGLIMVIPIIFADKSSDDNHQQEDTQIIDKELINELEGTKSIIIKDYITNETVKTIISESQIQDIITVLSHAHYFTAIVPVPSSVEPNYSMEFSNNNDDILEVIFIKKIFDENKNLIRVKFNFKDKITSYFFSEEEEDYLIRLIEEEI